MDEAEGGATRPVMPSRAPRAHHFWQRVLVEHLLQHGHLTPGETLPIARLPCASAHLAIRPVFHGIPGVVRLLKQPRWALHAEVGGAPKGVGPSPLLVAALLHVHSTACPEW